ncbi:hypothetical protein IQ07DRAFT_645326 [Pyrenochaeta sp. DS3sAY3a]|nr:hypothetical protein IQ07DRAFT_645326 [Pyrenochaeta sp. DS3sAY3a]
MPRARLQARQTAGSELPTVTYQQPSTTLALSTTFTPAASCYSNKLTMLPPPYYYIWANEPVPFAGTTVTNCYPPEFLASYTSVESNTFGSSIVPVMSPLACPANFCTKQVGDDNYIVCCPSGYDFQPPATPRIRDRPAYGGTCISKFTQSQSVTVLKYDINGETNIEPWTAPGTQDHAYAHPIDGFAATFPKIGCPAPPSSSFEILSASPSTNATTSSLSSASSAVANASGSSNTSSKVSPGTIAGAVVGSILGLAAIIGLIFFLLRRRKHHRSESAQRMHQVEDDFGVHRVEKDSNLLAAEMASVRSDKYGHNADGQVYEMNAQPVHEMPGAPLPYQK